MERGTSAAVPMTEASPRVAFTTLGCKVNQSETDLLARQFRYAGYRCVDFDEPSDVYVINTCTVTHVADKKSRQLIGQARRANPEALIVATGCYASIVGETLGDEHTLVVRNRDKEKLLTLVEGRRGGFAPDLPYFADAEKYLPVRGGQERSRAMVKVQDGCDSHCAYCIIPRARGRSRSVTPPDVLRRVNALVEEGHAEVVVTGVDLGSYGDDDQSLPDLGGLLQQILDHSEVKRIRVSSLEPGDFREEWLQLWKSERLCGHLHVPLQAGSHSVLKRMERKYSPEDFAEMVKGCREAVSDVTVTTDVMVGFPGETDEEFDEGHRFIHDIEFDGMHVFKYSKRSGTRAARMETQVREEVKSERSRLLREEAEAGVGRLIARHRNTTKRVVWESQNEGIWKGLTDTNVRVYGRDTRASVGGMTMVRLGSRFSDGVWAESRLAEIPLSLRSS